MQPSAVVILAGGQSSRMGQPKALLPLPDGKTVLDHHLCHAQVLGCPVLLADNGKNFSKQSSVQTISDHLPSDTDGKGAGALSAICSAMKYVMKNPTTADGYLLIISCDSLIKADRLFVHLQDKLSQTSVNNDEQNDTHALPYDVIYPKDHKDYPLLGLYHTRLLPSLMAYLDAGERSVMRFLVDQRTATVPVPSTWRQLVNFNTLQDFHLALQAYH